MQNEKDDEKGGNSHPTGEKPTAPAQKCSHEEIGKLFIGAMKLLSLTATVSAMNTDDFQQSFDRIMGVLTYNMPSGAGFVGGFLGGVRS